MSPVCAPLARGVAVLSADLDRRVAREPRRRGSSSVAGTQISASVSASMPDRNSRPIERSSASRTADAVHFPVSGDQRMNRRRHSHLPTTMRWPSSRTLRSKIRSQSNRHLPARALLPLLHGLRPSRWAFNGLFHARNSTIRGRHMGCQAPAHAAGGELRGLGSPSSCATAWAPIR